MTTASVSSRMRAVRRKETGAEEALKNALREYRLHFGAHIPMWGCKPDIVFRKNKLVVFVDGDFWHGRILIESGLKNLTNSFRPASRKFWIDKILRNVQRDKKQVNILRRHGWAVLRFWEKDILPAPGHTARIIYERLQKRRRYLKHQRDVS